MQALISIIIPVYQGEKYIAKALQSAADQTYGYLEIIVVNDGSNDGSAQIVQKYMKKDRRIKYFYQTNKGLSAARNKGLHEASGEYVVFLDADDWLDLAMIEALFARLIGAEADIIVPLYNYFVAETTGYVKKTTLFKNKGFTLDKPDSYVRAVLLTQMRNWSVARGTIYKMAVIKANQLQFPEGYYAEDLIFNLGYLRNIRKLDVCSKAYYYYLVRQGSITHSFKADYLNSLLFIDEEVELHLSDYSLEQKEVRLILDSLLCRNIVLYLNSYISYNMGLKLPALLVYMEEVLAIERVARAFKNPKFRAPYWPSSFKSYYVVLIRCLLYSGLTKQAAAVMKIAAGVRGELCKGS